MAMTHTLGDGAPIAIMNYQPLMSGSASTTEKSEFRDCDPTDSGLLRFFGGSDVASAIGHA